MPHPLFAAQYTLCALAYGGGAVGMLVCGLFAQAEAGGIKPGEWTALGILVLVLGAVGAFLRWYLPARDVAFSSDLKAQRDDFRAMLEEQRTDDHRLNEQQRIDFAKMLAEQRDAFRDLVAEQNKHHTTNVNLISGSQRPSPKPAPGDPPP